jgi:hypothetical protein
MRLLEGVSKVKNKKIAKRMMKKLSMDPKRIMEMVVAGMIVALLVWILF